MCNKKLGWREKSAHWKRATAMLAAGIEMKIPPEWLECAPVIIRTGDENSAEVFDPRKGVSAAYAIAVQLVARQRITLMDCRITTDWDDEILLANPTESNQLYLFGGREFPKREVLNHRLEDPLPLGRGQVVEGTILASGLRPIPDYYDHGSRLSCILAFIDSDENEISQKVPLYANRAWKCKHPGSRRGAGLYAGPIPPPKFDINVEMQRRYDEQRSRQAGSGGNLTLVQQTRQRPPIN